MKFYATREFIEHFMHRYVDLALVAVFLFVIIRAWGPHSVRQAAVFSVKAHLWFWIIVAVGLATDLATKHIAFAYLQPGDIVTIAPQKLDLRLALNPGASGGADIDSTWISDSLRLCAAVVAAFLCCRRNLRWLHIALALLLAGALGNITDRAYFMRAETIRYLGDNGPRVSAVTSYQESPKGLMVQIWGHTEPHLIPWSSHPEILGERATVRDFIGVWGRKDGRYVNMSIMNVADLMLAAGTTVVIILVLLAYLDISLYILLRRPLTTSPPPPTIR